LHQYLAQVRVPVAVLANMSPYRARRSV
jgi:hypothetical protein